MNRSTLLIVGLLILSFLGLLVGFYFFYPQINEEKFAEISTAYSEEDSTKATSMVGTPYLRTYDDITNQIEYLLNEQLTLQITVDSLNNLKEELSVRLSEIQNELDNPNNQGGLEASEAASQAGLNVPANQTGPQDQQSEQPQNLYAAMETVQLEDKAGEAFADRVKSLLNLDEEELAPILSKLNNDQLTRLYRSAGNIQREKLLRSLNPDRAASLMDSIML